MKFFQYNRVTFACKMVPTNKKQTSYGDKRFIA
jgi:hypothetical protein